MGSIKAERVGCRFLFGGVISFCVTSLGGTGIRDSRDLSIVHTEQSYSSVKLQRYSLSNADFLTSLVCRRLFVLEKWK